MQKGDKRGSGNGKALPLAHKADRSVPGGKPGSGMIWAGKALRYRSSGNALLIAQASAAFCARNNMAAVVQAVL